MEQKAVLISTENSIHLVLHNLLLCSKNNIPNLPAHKTGGHPLTRILLSMLVKMSEIINGLLFYYPIAKNNYPMTIATSSVRALFEIHLVGCYLMINPKETNAYIEYQNSVIEENELIQRCLQQIYESGFDENDCVKRITERKKSKPWTDKNVYQMAQATDHVFEYRTYYKYLCDWVHGSIVGMDGYMNISKEGFTAINSYANTSPAVSVIFSCAAQFYACYISSLMHAFDCNIDAEIKKCWDTSGNN